MSTLRSVKCCMRLLGAVVIALSIAIGLVLPAPVSAGFGTWTTNGPSANISAVAVDPSNEQTVYAAGTGGLWKSTNSGGSWTSLNALTPLGRRIVVDPFAASTLYAISGDSHSVLKSTTGGTSWTTVYTTTAGNQLNDIVPDPNTANMIYAAQGGTTAVAVLRSTDGGATWTGISDPNIGMGGIGGAQITGLSMLPGVSNLLYAAVQVYHGGFVMKTDNANASPMPTWTTIANGVQPLSAPFQVVVAGNAATRSTYSSWVLMGFGELARNDNDGAPVKLGSNLPYRGGSGQSSYISAMTVNPKQPNWLYAAIQSTPSGQQGVFASPDQGQTWNEFVHLDKFVGDLKLAVSTHTLYAATENGVYQFTITWPVAARFAGFYTSHDGLRLLGNALSAESIVNSYHSQYFEKGRIEDHQGESSDPNWRFMYGLLVDELHQRGANLPVGGDVSSMSYADLHNLADPSLRVPPPAGYPGSGTYMTPDGNTFIPFTANLSGANGHVVLGGFWNYMNRTDLFPGGWLHDIGLPIMEPKTIVVTKYFPGGPVMRTITVQAFQRTILTYDPANPPDWQIERANVGNDYRMVFPDRVGP